MLGWESIPPAKTGHIDVYAHANGHCWRAKQAINSYLLHHHKVELNTGHAKTLELSKLTNNLQL